MQEYYERGGLGGETKVPFPWRWTPCATRQEGAKGRIKLHCRRLAF